MRRVTSVNYQDMLERDDLTYQEELAALKMEKIMLDVYVEQEDVKKAKLNK